MISEEMVKEEEELQRDKLRLKQELEIEKRRKTRASLVREALIQWNKMARGILMVVKAQKELDYLISEKRVSIEEFPLNAQSILAQVNPRGQLERVLEGLAYAIRSEMELMVDIPPKEKEEKVEKESKDG